ncbi:MAG: DUF4406 domain-containing protein [Phycisphaera sp.]|nr:DUF4406 domain-containing protein [Phycisphaera sp.]
MTSQGRIYIAGPMTGLPEHNFPAFDAAARRLEKNGWEVVNPADNFGGLTSLPRASYLRIDMALLLQCDALALLPCWEDSIGARLEYLLARELDLPIFDASTGEPVAELPSATVNVDSAVKVAPANSREGILDEATRLTTGTRHNDYGHPRDDFARTAQMWTGILAEKLRPNCEVTAMDVPLCMIAVKLARQAHRHKRDNLVDVAGYARTAAMIAGEE